MAALGSQEIERLRQRLHERQATLRDEVQALDDESQDTPGSVLHSQVEDLGEQGEERVRGAVRAAEQERDTRELQDIGTALDRMRSGSYGECLDCGTDIPLARLDAQPAALRCLPCQEKFEQTHEPPRAPLPPMQ